jgi:hypothetical protein
MAAAAPFANFAANSAEPSAENVSIYWQKQCLPPHKLPTLPIDFVSLVLASCETTPHSLELPQLLLI